MPPDSPPADVPPADVPPADVLVESAAISPDHPPPAALVQASLFSPTFNPADPHSAPDDIRNALSVLTGGMEMTPTGEIVPASNDPLSAESAQQRFIKGMLKKEEVAKARSAYMEFEVHALDLADPKDAAKYVEILNRFGAVGSQWQLEESPPCIVLDSLSDRKFRCITVVKTYKMQKMMPEPPVG